MVHWHFPKEFFLYFVFFFLVIVLRAPDAFFHAQFWAEDGNIWYANAYNTGGLHSIFLTASGYFQTVSRLVAWLSLALPMSMAPLVFNMLAASIQTIPAFLFVSSRFEKAIPQFSIRFSCALLLLLLPNTAEIQVNITNAQWWLALTAFMVLVADAHTARRWHIFDVSILLLAGLSGPFALLLSPIAWILVFLNRTKTSLQNAWLLSGTALVQLVGIFFINHGERLAEIPQYTALLVLKIFNRQILWGPLIGPTQYEALTQHTFWFPIFFFTTTLLALFLALYALRKAPIQVGLFVLFGCLVFISSLASPILTHTPEELLIPRNGTRYWFIPMCAFMAILIWNTLQGSRVVKILSGIFLATCLFGIVLEFRRPPFKEYSWEQNVQKFQQLPQGQPMEIPLNPRGWSMTLIKQ